MDIRQDEKFQKEFKKYLKKYRSLKDDLAVLEKALLAYPTGNGSKHWNTLKQNDQDQYIVKVRMMCRTVKGSSFRVVYYFNGKEFQLIFLEIYFKGNKENENRTMIDQFWNEKTKQTP